MVAKRKNKRQYKRQLSLLKKNLNDFVIGDNSNTTAIGNQTLQPQTNVLSNNFGMMKKFDENSASQNHVIENNIDDKIKMRLTMLL